MISKLYHNPIFERIFHTVVYCLKNELSNCASVLDIGCGPDSPIQYCTNIKCSVGVEPFESYLKKSKAKGIHTEYKKSKIEDLDFEDDSFDAVVMVEVLEHLPKKTGYEILKKCEQWAKKKVIVTSPNGFINQVEVDNNLLQKHLSGWSHNEMRKLGYKCRGLAGLKVLRQEVESATMGNDLTLSIRFKPRSLWFVIATFSQIFTYYLPNLAFEIFSVKSLNR